MNNIKLDNPAEHALDRLQDTELSPMEEVLFKSWTKANGIAKPDNVDDTTDYRGIWKHTGGHVLPHGQLKQISSRRNAENVLEKTLTDRLLDAGNKAAQTGMQKAKADAPKSSVSN